jgi:hypothetical protein
MEAKKKAEMQVEPNLEEAAGELRSLSKEKPLKGAELQRFKELCVFLREHNFTNAQISKLTDGVYSEVTLKQYTRGVKVKDSDLKEKALETLSRLAEEGLELRDVRATLEVDAKLDVRGVTVEAVADFIDALAAAKMEVKDLSMLDAKLKELKLSFKQLPEYARYISNMSQAGLDAAGFKEVHTAASKYGSLQAILAAITAYGTLLDVQKKSLEAEEKIDAAGKELERKTQEIQQIDEKKGRIHKEIEAAEQLRALGFDFSHVVKIKEISAKMGGSGSSSNGPGRVLEALSEYSSLVEIRRAKEVVQSEKEKLETATKELNIAYAHLQTVISMCNKLLLENKFTVEAIQVVYRAAERYGEPMSVLKAVEAYGSLQALQSKSVEQKKRILEADAILAERGERLSELDGRYAALEDSFLQLEGSLAHKIEQGYGEAMKNLSAAYSNSIRGIEQKNIRYAEIEAKARSIEGELKMARFIVSARSYPDLAKQLPAQTTVQFAEALERLCMAKGINPRIPITEELRGKFYSGLTVYDLVSWARRSLENYVAESAGGV